MAAELESQARALVPDGGRSGEGREPLRVGWAPTRTDFPYNGRCAGLGERIGSRQNRSVQSSRRSLEKGYPVGRATRESCAGRRRDSAVLTRLRRCPTLPQSRTLLPTTWPKPLPP